MHTACPPPSRPPTNAPEPPVPLASTPEGVAQVRGAEVAQHVPQDVVGEAEDQRLRTPHAAAGAASTGCLPSVVAKKKRLARHSTNEASQGRARLHDRGTQNLGGMPAWGREYMWPCMCTSGSQSSRRRKERIELEAPSRTHKDEMEAITAATRRNRTAQNSSAGSSQHCPEGVPASGQHAGHTMAPQCRQRLRARKNVNDFLRERGRGVVVGRARAIRRQCLGGGVGVPTSGGPAITIFKCWSEYTKKIQNRRDGLLRSTAPVAVGRQPQAENAPTAWAARLVGPYTDVLNSQLLGSNPSPDYCFSEIPWHRNPPLLMQRHFSFIFVSFICLKPCVVREK